MSATHDYTTNSAMFAAVRVLLDGAGLASDDTAVLTAMSVRNALAPLDARPTWLFGVYTAAHTCWADPNWDGTLAAEGKCAGCDEAAAHPCEFCGYGDVFTTHNDEAHLEGGDPTMPALLTDEWFNSPHTQEEQK
jgi:hypothetical protein